MFKLYSRGCEYALRALACFSVDQPDQRISPNVICKKAKIPKPYTQKIFQLLVQKGFLNSSTGPKGGYSFIKDPKSVPILDIVKAIDGDATFDRCVMGLSGCDDENPCPLHSTWKKTRMTLVEQLKNKSVYDVMKLKRFLK